MAARLLDPKADFAWLSEIEQDLALVMEPRSKFDRVVLAERLVEAGLTLVSEAETFAKHPFRRAIGIRNGLMIALLAVCPICIKNFAALEFGRTFKEEQGKLVDDFALRQPPRPTLQTIDRCRTISIAQWSYT